MILASSTRASAESTAIPPARSSNLLQRQCACGQHSLGVGVCDKCKKQQATIQRHPADHAKAVTAPPIVEDVLRSPGQPLDATARAFFEPRFGHDFGRVRVHTDAKAAESARSVNALAFTVGRDVVFGPAQYSPQTVAGRELLAHELAHTIQQSPDAAYARTPSDLTVGDPAAAEEKDAEAAGQAVLTARPPGVIRQSTGAPAIRRQRDPSGSAHTPQRAQHPEEGEAAGTIAQTHGTGGQGGSASTTPTCHPQGLDRATFVKKDSTTDFGLTMLDLPAVAYPSLRTLPAKPHGVNVAPTTAALPSIPSIFTKAGVFVEGDAIFLGQDQYSCASQKYPIKWYITTQGAQKIMEGEQEHCNDFQYAFDISLKQYAEAVNSLAAGHRVFPSQKAADAALKRITGVAPADWKTVFVCFAQKSLLRDPGPRGGPSWHTPRPTLLAPRWPDCKEARAIITAASLPEVGKHPSSEIIKGCGEKPAHSARTGRKE